MKKLIMLLTLAAFVIAVPFAMAADQPTLPKAAGSDQPSINCCAKGKCNKVASEADCAKEGGSRIVAMSFCEPRSW